MADEPMGANGAVEGSPAKLDHKVELDLDDAPFLADDPEPEPEPKKEESPVVVEKKTSAAPEDKTSLKDKLLANKKKLIIAGGAAVALLALAIVLNVVFSSDEPAPPPPPPPPPPAAEVVSATPKPLPPAPSAQFTMEWEPFWVELKDSEGAIRYLTLKFSIPTDNPNVFAEMNIKALILRDALFYYLRNQPIISLSDEAKVQAFKGDLLTVLNEHLGSGKVNEVLIEEYLVQ